MTLDQCKRGQLIRIESIPNDIVRAQAIRFGISEGAVVNCREVVPAGPVVVARHKQEIAIGRQLARSIVVETVTELLSVSTGVRSSLPLTGTARGA